MNHSDNNNDYNNVDTKKADPTPFPPSMSCFTAMGILLLLMVMCFVFTLLTLSFFIFCLATINLIEFWFRGDDSEMECREGFELLNGDLEDDEKAAKFLEAFFRTVKGKGERGRKESKKNVVGTIECFGSEELVELGYSECAICLEEFQKGEKCLVFPGCGHIFHCMCIACWLKKKKLTCPVCRYSVASNANGARGFRMSSWIQP